VLAPGDEAALDAFFAAHPHTTLFFQNNVATAGLVDRGARYQGTYVAAFDGADIVALGAHYWNGNLIIEADAALEAIVREVVAASGRSVSGLLGPWAQVCAARSALGLAAAAAAMDSPDDLLAIELASLRVPAALADGVVRCRAPRDAELELVAQWRHDYSVELIGRTPDAKLRATSRDEIAEWHGEGRTFVLETQGELVAFAGYNASTPACVQIGGVWTPHVLRGRGHVCFGHAWQDGEDETLAFVCLES
jgi:hypothetical protein